MFCNRGSLCRTKTGGKSMTRDEAQKAVEKHGSQRKAAAALGVCAKRLSKMLSGAAIASNKPATATVSEVTAASGGISLAGRQVLAERPTDLWKARFFALRRGLGYPIEALAAEWGKSVDSVKERAKRFGALRYVESPQRPGEYIVCAVHPETPKGK